MKGIKKLVGISLAAILVLSVFTGCGGGNRSETSNAPNTITLMTNDTTFEKYKEYIQKAEKDTGLTINVITSPSNSTDRLSKLTTILSSGDDSVDIMCIDDEMMSQFKSAGYLEPLQKQVMVPDVFKNFQVEYMKNRTMVGENIYSVPMYMEILAYWVDQNKVKAAGLTEAPKNKEEFMKFVKANSGTGHYGYGGAWEKTYVFNEIGTFVNLFGGEYTDWTNPKSREAVKFMYDMMKNNETPKGQLADQYDPMMQKFFDGTYASIFMYTGAMKTFVDSGKYGPEGIHMAPMPTFDKNVAFMASWHYVLNKASQKKEAALKFLRYAASQQGEKDYFDTTSRMPARTDVLNDPSFKAEGLDSIRLYLKNTVLVARPMAPQSMEFISSIGTLFQKYISDEITLDDYCTKAQEEVKKYMKK